MTTALSVESIPEVLSTLEKAFFDIPFENSAFQTRNFVIAAQQTPARAYRSIGLQMFAKIEAVREFQYQREMNQIELDEIEFKLTKLDDPFKRRRLQLKAKKIHSGESWGAKLLNDAIAELNILYAEFKRFPAYSREAFEAEEKAHFQQRLERQIAGGGAAEGIMNMSQDVASLEQHLSGGVPCLSA